MINKQCFRRKSRELRFSIAELDKFHDGMANIFVEIYKSNPDWKNIFKIEENKLWPVLKILSDPLHPIFDGADEITRKEFTNSIKDELEIRGSKSRLSEDSQKYLKILLKKRLAFMETIFEITPADILEFQKGEGSSWVKWLLFGSAVAVGAGTAAYLLKKDKK